MNLQSGEKIHLIIINRLPMIIFYITSEMILLMLISSSTAPAAQGRLSSTPLSANVFGQKAKLFSV
jgi:hypothetical protein